MNNKKLVHFKRSNLIIVLCFALIFIYYVFLAYNLAYNVNPDEKMRFLLPKYIYMHNQLPNGYDRGAMLNYGNWSYAFYPQWLGSLFSALFMKLFALFSTRVRVLLLGARLSSVLFGMLTIFFVFLSLRKLCMSKRKALTGAVLTGLLPQFTYLACYVNNDIIACSGVSIMIYSVICGHKRWNARYTITLALGMIICILGYMNSYGFVLSFGVYYLMSIYRQYRGQDLNAKRAILLISLLILIVIIFALPFFVRNYLLYSDPFGMHVFHQRYEEWLINGGRKLQYPMKGNLKLWLRWLPETVITFIGVFGYITVILNPLWYAFYLLIFLFGLISFIKIKIPKEYNNILVTCIAGSIITTALSLYYSVFTDFQPQGRYLISILPFITIIVTTGIYSMLKKIRKVNLDIVINLIYILANLLIYVKYIIPNLF